LSASYYYDTIAWYENDGSGGFSSEQIISTLADGAISVSTADVDGDGDLDVLSASLFDDTIAWYENDGSGGFSSEQIISTLADGAFSVTTADVDGDGDLDVLSASRFDNTIAWYENDGSGGFSSEQIISTLANGASSVTTADVDGDGDLDVLSSSRDDDTIAWYENDGSGGFSSEQIISTLADGAISVSTADVDGDGDLDVLSASSRDGTIAVYENTGLGVGGEESPFIIREAELLKGWSDPEGDPLSVLNLSSSSGSLIDNGDGTWTFTPDPAFTGTVSLSFEVVDGKGGSTEASQSFAIGDPVCFLAGTRIATPTGERPIETLQPGDLIHTTEGPRAVRFISRTTHFASCLANDEQLPIRIAAGALGDLGPVRDLYVSPDHAVLLDGHLIHASVLVNGTTITRTSLEHWRQLDQPIEYLNIELEQHQLITAEGLTVESFVDNRPRCDWDNYTAYLSLYGQELPIAELPLPRIKFSRQLPSRLRRQLSSAALVV
ncbi:MAG: FG-GAP-like repeat-containing protein, partial [Cyanobacteriota bacterium]